MLIKNKETNKKRVEIEVINSEVMNLILGELGFHCFFKIKKHRKSFKLDKIKPLINKTFPLEKTGEAH